MTDTNDNGDADLEARGGPMLQAAGETFDQMRAHFLEACAGDADAADCMTVTALSFAHAKAVANMMGLDPDTNEYVEAIQIAVAGLVQGIDLCLAVARRKASAPASVN
jgi:hypothetical protein